MASTLNLALGSRVVMLIRPAEALLPYRVLCGPRSTSIRSTSVRSEKARAWKETGTSSSWTATLGSTPMP
ncbi:hypothetical protein D3C86_2059710 [compost metagenome]